MNEIKISGTVHKVGDVQRITERFSKRQLVIDTGDKFSPYLPIDFSGKVLDLPAKLSVGQEVTVHLNLGGRESKGKFWPNISGWKIEVGEGGNSPEPDSWDQSNNNEDDSDIPF